MEVVDRHGWVDGMTIRSYGVHVGLRVDEKENLPRMLELLPPEWAPSERLAVRRLYSLRTARKKRRSKRAERRRINVLYMNAVRLDRSNDVEHLLRRFEMDLMIYVAERAPRRIFVHAGVVGWKGKAIVLPGMSLSGKTTLVRALLDLGADFYSDEYAVLDHKGRVHPFHRPLSIRRRKYDAEPDRVPAEELGATLGRKPLPVALVALTRYDPDSKAFRPTTLSPGRAVLATLENTVPAQRRPKVALRTLRLALADAEVVRGRRPDAHATAESLLRRLG